MTREEATQIMSTWLVSSKGAKGQRGYIEGWFDEEDAEAFRMAIEALSANATVAKIQIDDIDKAKTSSQLLDDLAVDMVNAMGKRIVEVVRCKDCRYCEECYDTDGYPYWICNEWDGGTDADGFCHYGERKHE